jgi:hypothetical protein
VTTELNPVVEGLGNQLLEWLGHRLAPHLAQAAVQQGIQNVAEPVLDGIIAPAVAPIDAGIAAVDAAIPELSLEDRIDRLEKFFFSATGHNVKL